MNPLLTFFYDRIREDFGIPAKLLRLIAEHSDMRVDLIESSPVIAASSIVPWHKWGAARHADWPRRKAGWTMGWKDSGGGYSSFEIQLQPLTIFGQCHETTHWTCDIQDIQGFSSSKSNLIELASMDEMVERNSREMIDEISHEKLRKNLGHSEIRIIHSKNDPDYFARHRWDGRVFLINGGGSHHFAAARYIAARLGQRVPLTGKLYTYEINKTAVAALRCDYDMFVISDEAPVAMAFHDAMRSFKATYLWHHMPQQYEKTKAIFLPRANKRSMRVAKTLREVGMFDLGRYLTQICELQ